MEYRWICASTAKTTEPDWTGQWNKRIILSNAFCFTIDIPSFRHYSVGYYFESSKSNNSNIWNHSLLMFMSDRFVKVVLLSFVINKLTLRNNDAICFQFYCLRQRKINLCLPNIDNNLTYPLTKTKI